MNAISAPVASILIYNLSDLQVFGINSLTGEACAYGLRLLCDVTEEGKTLVQDYLGLPEAPLQPPMNSTVDGKPTVGSLMLPRSCWHELATFAGFQRGALACVQHKDGSQLLVFSEETLAQYERSGLDFDIRRNPALTSLAPRLGSRNIHQMTGRAM